MKYIFILFMSVCFLPMQLDAQTEDTSRDKVILRDGSVLVGKIVEYEMGDFIILSIHGNQVRIEDAEVKRVVMDDKGKRNYSFRTERFYNRTNFSMLSNSNGTGVSLNYSLNYAFSRWLLAGGGLGIDNYYAKEGRNIYPLFMEIKSYLIDNNSSPYLSLKGGYGFNFTNEKVGQTSTQGGPFINPTFGYRFGSRGLMFDSYIGFRTQTATYESITGSSESKQDIQWYRVELGVGISF